MGRHERASEHYEAFVALDDRAPRVLYKLALAYYRSGQVEKAINPLRDATELDGRFTEAHYLLGMCLRERRQDEEALRALARAVEINPAFVPAREEMVDLFDRTGRRQEALEQLEALAALESTSAERLVDVGLAYARWGRTDLAIPTLGLAAERFPDEPVIHTALGRVWLETAELLNDPVALSKALEALQPSASPANASGEALTLYGRATMLSGDTAVAERALLLATEKRPVEPAAFRYLADVAEQLGHTTIARDALLRYVALVGEDAVDVGVAQRLARLQ